MSKLLKLFGVLAVMLSFVFVGCGDDDDKSIVGNWRATGAWGETVDLVVNSNGTGTITVTYDGLSAGAETFTWKDNNNGTFTVVFSDGESTSISFSGGNSFTVTDDGYTFNFTRR